LLSSPVISCTCRSVLDFPETDGISSWGTVAAGRGHNLRHRGRTLLGENLWADRRTSSRVLS
jgi:hypothetical protein